jgi:hypothetical protein
MDALRRPAWREPMLWLVVAMPACVVVAAVVTIRAANLMPGDSSAADTRRIAQMQLQDLGPDREAARRGLQAQLKADSVTGRVDVTFASPGLRVENLELAMLHPIREGEDRHLALHWNGESWRGVTDPWRQQDWELRLAATDGEWRLSARLVAGADAATLQPGVQD